MNYFKLPKVGLRTFKSGLAVFLCLLLIPNEPFFACLTAVICLGGTIIGAFFGLLFLFIFRFLENHIANTYVSKLLIYMLIGFGIIIMISICNKVKRPGAINITCISFLGVTTAHAYSDPLYYALNRSCETILGIIISILVNTLITPPPHK